MSLSGIWVGMIRRCGDYSDANFKYYGGRGIRVCPQWATSLCAFEADMGLRPGLEYSVDRIDVNGNYCPENCRWATRKEQANNTRRTKKVWYLGQRHTLMDWSIFLQIDVSQLHYTRQDRLIVAPESLKNWRKTPIQELYKYPKLRKREKKKELWALRARLAREEKLARYGPLINVLSNLADIYERSSWDECIRILQTVRNLCASTDDSTNFHNTIFLFYKVRELVTAAFMPNWSMPKEEAQRILNEDVIDMSLGRIQDGKATA